jgi:CRP-like cAMP-binding protein
VGPGTLVGEVAALRGIARTASVQAHGKLEVLELQRADFEALLDSQPEIKRRVLDVVSQRARDNIDKVMGGGGFFPRG